MHRGHSGQQKRELSALPVQLSGVDRSFRQYVYLDVLVAIKVNSL